jgi:hypothetical protein
VVDTSSPDGLERRGAPPGHRRVVRHFVAEELSVAREVTEPDPTLVEQPVVVCRQAQVRGAPAGQPPDLRNDGSDGT